MILYICEGDLLLEDSNAEVYNGLAPLVFPKLSLSVAELN